MPRNPNSKRDANVINVPKKERIVPLCVVKLEYYFENIPSIKIKLMKVIIIVALANIKKITNGIENIKIHVEMVNARNGYFASTFAVLSNME